MFIYIDGVQIGVGYEIENENPIRIGVRNSFTKIQFVIESEFVVNEVIFGTNIEEMK